MAKPTIDASLRAALDALPPRPRTATGRVATGPSLPSAPRTHLTPASAGGVRWLAADEWFADYLRRISDHRYRRRLLGERSERPWDYPIRAAREYDAETEQFRRYLQHESMKDEQWVVPAPTTPPPASARPITLTT